MVQCLGWNQPRTAATPPPARGSTSSHTWRKIKHQHVTTAARYDQLEILVHAKPFTPAVTQSAVHWELWRCDPLSASPWISTYFCKSQLASHTVEFLSVAAASLFSLSSPITGQQSNYLKQKKTSSFFLTQQAPQTLCFEVSLLKSVSWLQKSKPAFVWGISLITDQEGQWWDYPQLPSQENCRLHLLFSPTETHYYCACFVCFLFSKHVPHSRDGVWYNLFVKNWTNILN